MTMLGLSAGPALFILRYTDRATPTILTLFNLSNQAGWLCVFLILIQFGILVSLSMGLTVLASISIIVNFSAQSILERFKRFPLRSNLEYSKNDELERFNQLLFSYKQLQLCLVLFNEIFRPYFLILVTNGLTGLSVMALVLLIGYHHHVEILTLLSTIVIMIMATVSVILIYYECGTLNDASVKCLKRLKRETTLSELTKDNKVLLHCYVKSLQSLKIDYSFFGYYKKLNCPRIITRIIYYSVKGIITLRKII